MGFGQKIMVALLLVVVIAPPLAGFYSYFSGLPLRLLAAKKEDEDKEADGSTGITLVPGQPHTLAISDGIAATLGIRKGDKDSVGVARAPTMMRPLVLPGSTGSIPPGWPHPCSIRTGPGRRDRARSRFFSHRRGHPVPRAQAGRHGL